MPPDTDLSDTQKNRLLQIHLAEFEALSNRLTYWLTLQYVPYTIAAAIVAFFVQSWDVQHYPHISSNRAWASLLMLQLLLWAVLQSTHEVLTYVVYFKECLKPQMQQLLGHDGPSYLHFERFVAKLRQKWFLRFETRFGLIAIAITAMLAACTTAIYNTLPPRLCRGSTVAWGLTNGYVLFILVGKSWDIGKLQQRAEAADPEKPVCP